jgi:hypothetical protein
VIYNPQSSDQTSTAKAAENGDPSELEELRVEQTGAEKQEESPNAAQEVNTDNSGGQQSSSLRQLLFIGFSFGFGAGVVVSVIIGHIVGR